MLVVEKEKVIMDYFKFDGVDIEVVSAVNRYGTLPIRYYDDLNLSGTTSRKRTHKIDKF